MPNNCEHCGVDLSVVIVTYGHRDAVISALSSLGRNIRSDYQVIVVDNASKDDTLPNINSIYPDVRTVQLSENLGFGAACNIGAKFGQGRYLLFLNPDAILNAPIDSAIAYMDANADVGIVGGRMEDAQGAYRQSAGVFPSFFKLARLRWMMDRRNGLDVGDFVDERSSLSVDWVEGSFMLVRGTAWQRVGGFDPDYFLYVEDVDLAWRIREAGFSVRYLPSISFLHDGGWSDRRLPHLMQGYRVFFKKHGSGFQRFFIACFLDCLVLVKAVTFFVMGAVSNKYLHKSKCTLSAMSIFYGRIK